MYPTYPSLIIHYYIHINTGPWTTHERGISSQKRAWAGYNRIMMSEEPLPDMEGRPNCQVVTDKIPNLLGSKAMGVDWGARRIGLGVTAGFSQSPVTVISNKARTSRNVSDHIPELDTILRYAKNQGVARIVVGMPYYR